MVKKLNIAENYTSSSVTVRKFCLVWIALGNRAFGG
jgi:hypothetical protein